MKQWLQDTAIRTVKTFAQALIGSLSVGGIGLLEVDWVSALSVAGMSALICVLTCVSTIPTTTEETESEVE